MYRCVIVGLLLLLRVCHGKTKKANLTSCREEQTFPSWIVLFGTTEESLLHQLEVRNERVHEVWWLVAGVGKHLVPSLFYAELGGSLGVRWFYWTSLSLIFGRREKVTVRRLKSLVCLYRVINVHLYFHTIYTRENELWRWSSTLAWCPLSLPSLLHSPYLLPLFTRQPSCSALMRGHLKLLGWREGDGALR